MSLAPGVRLGPYEITAQIGVGGMGEVYRATDTNLKRQVAIKVLPASVAGDAERLARFQREAEVLAALNHPNIAQIHGLEKSDGTIALVMELVEGPTLADRIAEGAMPLDEALPIAKQIAEAVEAAHEQGIIHRDLKPANIKVRHDGTVKVLDFGLARVLEPPSALDDLANSPTITSPAMTQQGVILGTAAYMSPEQARAKPIDKRTDIWALGCLLYEMLTGRRAFVGEDVTETLAAIVKTEPDLSAVPHKVRRLLAKCLEKDPKRRLRDIGDVWELLEHDDPGGVEGPVRPGSTRWVWMTLTGAAVTATLLAVWWPRPTVTPARTTRFAHVLAENEGFSSNGRTVVAVSRDGTRIAYVASQQIYVRDLDNPAARRLTEAEGGRANPVFSPDGKWIAFWSRGDGLVKVPVTGGTLVPLCAASMPLGVTWGVDDRLVFGQPNGIMGVSASGGKCELLVATEGGEQASSPEMLPDGRTLLYSLRSGSQPWDRAVIAVQSIGGGRRKQVWDGGADAHYVSTGHLLYAVANTLFAVPFDLSRLEITGVPVPVVEGVRREAVGGGVTGSAHYAISDDGTFVYATGDRQQQRVLVWVDRQNREEPIPIQPRTYANPRISPNGRSIALTTRDAGFDVWVWDVARRNLRQLTSDAPRNYNAAWYPDSKRLAISVLYGPESGISPARQEVRVYAADGSGQPRVIPQLPPEGILSAFPASISRDERMVLHTYGPPTEDTLLFSAADASAPVRIVKAPGNERNPTISPDGHWLAYESDRTGRFEIYVSPFPNVEDGAQQVTRTGAVMPLWERDGRELYYWTETGSTMAIEAVPIVGGPSFSWGPAREIIRGRYARSHTQERQYDVWGDRFLFLKPVEGNKPPSPPRIEVVTNWFEELKRLVPIN